MKSLRNSPIALFLQVLLIVFLVEAGVMFVLPFVLPRRTPDTARAFADACLLTLLCAPLLWWTIILPLRRVAAMEQAKAEALNAAAAEGMITFDDHGIIRSFSRAAQQIFGYREEEVVGGDLGSLIPWQFLTRRQEGGGDASRVSRLLQGTVKLTGRRKDGSEVPLALSISQARIDSHPIYMAVVRDLVDREREEMHAEQMAAVAQLGTALAHRLRNPLTSIKMLVQAGTRQDGPLTLDHQDLRFMEDGIRRMERSLQLFLDFAQPKKLQRQHASLSSILEEAIAQVQERAALKRVAIRFARPEESLEADVDAQQLGQAVQRLLHNAIDASPPDEAIQVGLQPLDSAEIEIRVSDAGPGIPADVAPQLFRPFFTTKATGVGLGLVLARRIAEEHGGRVSLANRPGGGARAALTVPRAGGSPS